MFLYPAEATVDAGDTLRLHVHDQSAPFRLRLERWGAGESVPLLDAGPFGQSDRINIAVPRDTPAGAYVVRSIVDAPQRARGGPRDGTPDARWGAALFVVRRAPRARVLVSLPLFTYHAYNIAYVDGTRGDDEGACLYSGHNSISLLRPGGGTGGHPWDEVNVDAYDTSSPRQTFAHWDLPALNWLTRAGLGYDVCTDLDVHRGAVPLDRYDLLCTFGHDEYWTREKRVNVERFIEAGGNAAFFGGNTCWFRVRYDEPSMSIARDGKWSDDEPEDRLTGLSFRRGGGKWIGRRPATGFDIVTDHPLLAAAGVHRGDVIGAGCSLAGYECDGIDPQFTPGNLTVLGTASLDAWDVSDGSGEVAPGGHAAMALFERGDGAVFNAGTVDWARCLLGDMRVALITRAVIATMLGRRRTGRGAPDTALSVSVPPQWRARAEGNNAMDTHSENTEERLHDVEVEDEQNMGIKPDAARVVAEDQVLRGVPAPSSQAVDDERASRARQEETKQ